MNNFTFSQFVFEMKALDALQFPAYKGSTLRGAFGHAFKRVVCTLRKNSCADCLLRQRCVYCYVFETPPPDNAEMMKKYTAAPHPFVILPPPEEKRLYKPGEGFSFCLTLIGKASEYLPYFIYTFNELGKTGIGKDRGTYNLLKVTKADTGEVVYDGSGKILHGAYKTVSWEELAGNGKLCQTEELTLRFQTPTRIRYSEDLVFDLEFHMLMRTLLRRISLLSYFHCGSRLDLDFRGLINEAKSIEVKRRSLKWHDWERYSNRQQTRMKLGGFVGDITFTGEFGKFLPYIILGQHIHVGKGTSFGLGKYEIQ